MWQTKRRNAPIRVMWAYFPKASFYIRYVRTFHQMTLCENALNFIPNWVWVLLNSSWVKKDQYRRWLMLPLFPHFAIPYSWIMFSHWMQMHTINISCPAGRNIKGRNHLHENCKSMSGVSVQKIQNLSQLPMRCREPGSARWGPLGIDGW